MDAQTTRGQAEWPPDLSWFNPLSYAGAMARLVFTIVPEVAVVPKRSAIEPSTPCWPLSFVRTRNGTLRQFDYRVPLCAVELVADPLSVPMVDGTVADDSRAVESTPENRRIETLSVASSSAGYARRGTPCRIEAVPTRSLISDEMMSPPTTDHVLRVPERACSPLGPSSRRSRPVRDVGDP